MMKDLNTTEIENNDLKDSMLFETSLMADINHDILNPDLYSYETTLSPTFLNHSQNMLVSNLNTSLRQLSKLGGASDLIAQVFASPEYLVNLSPQDLENIKDGMWEFMATKNGMQATLKHTANSSGRGIAKNLTVVPKKLPVNLTGFLVTLAIQQSLDELIKLMKKLNNKLDRIERGQRDDRISLFYSARQQYIEAMSMNNRDLKEILLVNSLKTINDCIASIKQEVISDLHLLKNEKEKQKDSRIYNISEAIKFINDGTGLAVSVYTALGEHTPLIATLKNYETFLVQVIQSNEELLHEKWNPDKPVHPKKPLLKDKSGKQEKKYNLELKDFVEKNEKYEYDREQWRRIPGEIIDVIGQTLEKAQNPEIHIQISELYIG